jgi:transposase-like protein
MPRNVDVDRQEFVRLWNEGASVDRIAKRFDIHRNTVLRKVCEMKLPPRERQVDVPLLFQLWADMTLTRVEVARKLGVTEGNLTRLAARHGLGRRGRQHRAFSMDDPTPEEIAQRAQECRERHMALRRAEDTLTTDRKVNHWRAGTYSPQGGRA